MLALSFLALNFVLHAPSFLLLYFRAFLCLYFHAVCFFALVFLCRSLFMSYFMLFVFALVFSYSLFFSLLFFALPVSTRPRASMYISTVRREKPEEAGHDIKGVCATLLRLYTSTESLKRVYTSSG